MKANLSYESRLLVILCITLGCMTFDRLAVNFLSPYIVEEFGLTAAQIGILASVLALANIGSGIAAATLSDRHGARKSILLWAMMAYSLVAASAGFASSFLMLLACRTLLGLSKGPIVPIAQTLMAIESSPHRRGLNMGLLQNLGAFVLGATIGPLLVVWLADTYGWRNAFFLTAAPGLLMVLLLAKFVREPAVNAAPPSAAGVPASASGSMLRNRNLLLCMAIAAFFTVWLLVQNTFLPLYLTRILGFTPSEMSRMLAITGVGSCVGSVILPLVSDRIGRKPTMILAGIIALISPLVVLFGGGSSWLLPVGLFLGWTAAGCLPIFVALIPSESVEPGQIARAVAYTLACGEFFGGVFAPTFAGRMADIYGLAAPFWIVIAAVAMSIALACMLRETAPSIRNRRPSLADRGQPQRG